jgi:hypothetical protein
MKEIEKITLILSENDKELKNKRKIFTLCNRLCSNIWSVWNLEDSSRFSTGNFQIM